MERVILHADLNSFYASVECLHRPSLRQTPMAVGGDVDARHGIVLAKNELAKRYGIQTGEALWQARQKCPDIVFVKADFPLYLRFSRLVREIYLDYTPQVEPFGIDEAWLDITGEGVDGEKAAQEIRQRIKREIGVTVSVGVSFNKVFAKLGSDMKKPDAVTVVSRVNYREKVWPLPAGDLLYVGHATQRKLRAMGIDTIGDIANMPSQALRHRFGKIGEMLHNFANGLEFSPVAQYDESSLVKSIGNSMTTPRDLLDDNDVKIAVTLLSESVAARMREQGFLCRTAAISVRDNRLACFERQRKLASPTNLSAELANAAMELFRASYHWEAPIRSIGVRAMDLLADGTPIQLALFLDEEKRIREERLEKAIDVLRRRFGYSSIQRAVLLQDPDLASINPKEDHTIHPQGYL